MVVYQVSFIFFPKKKNRISGVIISPYATLGIYRDHRWNDLIPGICFRNQYPGRTRSTQALVHIGRLQERLSALQWDMGFNPQMLGTRALVGNLEPLCHHHWWLSIRCQLCVIGFLLFNVLLSFFCKCIYKSSIVSFQFVNENYLNYKFQVNRNDYL